MIEKSIDTQKKYRPDAERHTMHSVIAGANEYWIYVG